ncbi:MAG: PAS domain S-box protein [Deltaproteobacteria bacterium]|nr:PAS domain S-box protein [Deltaproteobacteria bacterium]
MLRESEEQLRAVVANAADSIITVDELGNINSLNPGAEKLFGYREADLMGENIQVLTPSSSGSDEASLDQAFQMKEQTHLGSSQEVLGQRRDGTTFPLDMTVSEMLLHGQRFFTGVIRDISTRRQMETTLRANEARFHQLAEMSPIGIYLTDAHGLYVYTNQRWQQISGLTFEDSLGAKWTNAIARQDYESVVNAWQTAIASQQDIIKQEFHFQHPDGEQRTVTSHAIGLYWEDKTISGYVGIVDDITLRRKAEAIQQRYATELERSNKELEQFAYVSSHDLQEPLRMVASYCRLLQRRYADKLDQDANEFITYAVEGATRMQVLINDLLAYSRVRRKERTMKQVSCQQILERSLVNLQQSIRESQATITSDPLPALMGDETQLHQLFQNLLSNAIKYRGDEAPRIHIGIEQQENGWLFSVRDNGIGIAPHYHERIFQIFQRLHERGKYPGTGIGLAICSKVVEIHGGRIWVDSIEGKGSTFFFTLPKVH